MLSNCRSEVGQFGVLERSLFHGDLVWTRFCRLEVDLILLDLSNLIPLLVPDLRFVEFYSELCIV